MVCLILFRNFLIFPNHVYLLAFEIKNKSLFNQLQIWVIENKMVPSLEHRKIVHVLNEKIKEQKDEGRLKDLLTKLIDLFFIIKSMEVHLIANDTIFIFILNESKLSILKLKLFHLL